MLFNLPRRCSCWRRASRPEARGWLSRYPPRHSGTPPATSWMRAVRTRRRCRGRPSGSPPRCPAPPDPSRLGACIQIQLVTVILLTIEKVVGLTGFVIIHVFIASFSPAQGDRNQMVIAKFTRPVNSMPMSTWNACAACNLSHRYLSHRLREIPQKQRYRVANLLVESILLTSTSKFRHSTNFQ